MSRLPVGDEEEGSEGERSSSTTRGTRRPPSSEPGRAMLTLLAYDTGEVDMGTAEGSLGRDAERGAPDSCDSSGLRDGAVERL